MRAVPYPTPGEILAEEFLDPMGITRYRLAKEIGVPQRRVDEIVSGQRAITADTALRLSRYFGMSDVFWLNVQSGYDARATKARMAKTLAQITPVRAPESDRVQGPQDALPAPVRRSGRHRAE